jgi:hypothetical protein
MEVVRLRFGESYARKLRMADYVNITTPGKYTFRVLFHGSRRIAPMDPDKVDGLILASSASFRITVAPRVVEVSESDRKRIRDLIGRLPANGVVKIYRGPFDDWGRAFMSADTICTGTYGSGVATGTRTLTKMRGPATRKAPVRVRPVFCAAAVGMTIRRAVDLRSASWTGPTSGATSTGFALPWT